MTQYDPLLGFGSNDYQTNLGQPVSIGGRSPQLSTHIFSVA
jgi:hypothetical protein